MKKLLTLLTAGLVGMATIEAQDNFIRLNGGMVTLGSPESERLRGKDERQHRITLSSFYVDPYEVTQADYERLMGKNPSYNKGARLPVENVTWYDAIEYCNALSASRGLAPVYARNGKTVTWNRAANGYRLLTEAEWEYACRAGTTTIFNTGNQVHSDSMNFQGSYPYMIEENYVRRRDASVRTSRNRSSTIAVDELPPNQFGLYNMHGNVSEWCFDYYGEYVDGATNPAGAEAGHLRVNRGGGYNDFGKHLRSAYRSALNPDEPDRNTGFRLARNADAQSGAFTTTYDLTISVPRNPKILIAYYSYSGNTENAAKIIQRKTGADIVEIEMQNPYRGNIYDVSQADLYADTRPPIATRVQNIAQYDVILLGFPTWWATIPMPVLTFLDGYDVSGKMIVPFSSHGGTVLGDSTSDLSKYEQNAYIGLPFEFYYSGGRDLETRIDAWLKQNGVQ